MTTTLRAGRRRIDISHADKVLFAGAGLTKLDLAHHYERVSEPLLRQIRDHPIAMQAFPDGNRVGRLLRQGRARPRFAEVRAAARALGELLRDEGLEPFAMTTGSRGLHVVAALRRGAAFDAVRAFARVIAERSPRRTRDG
jgi:DNA primase